MGEVTLLTFKPAQAREIVLKFGYKIRGDAVLGKSGKRATCVRCGKKLTVQNVGRVMPGSFELLCDDLICINSYAVQHLDSENSE